MSCSAADYFFVAEDEGSIDAERNMKTPEHGSATSVWCATSPQLEAAHSDDLGLGGSEIA